MEGARLDRNQAIARVRFAKDDTPAERAWRKVAQDVLRQVSVGYDVHRWADTRDAAGLLTRTAVDWEPFVTTRVPPRRPGGARTWGRGVSS